MKINHKQIFLILLSTLFLNLFTVNLATAAVQKIILTEDNVVQLTQRQSPAYKDVQSRSLISDYNYQLINSVYRLNLNFDYSLQKDNTESITTLGVLGGAKKLTNNLSVLTLTKKFVTGTTATAQLTNLQSQSGSTNTEYTQNYYSLSLEQNIYPLMLANVDALTLSAAESDRKRIDLQTELDLIDATKDALTLYWKTVALQKSVQEQADIIKRYDTLATTVTRKKRNSYANPGEFEQALAEYESRKQAYLSDINTLKISMQQLKTLLNIPAESDVELASQTKSNVLPQPFTGDIKKLKRYEVQRLKTDSAADLLTATYYKDAPQISVYGRYLGQGVDSDSSKSFKELTTDPTNQYIIGIKLNYFFDNELIRQERKLRALQQDIETTRYTRLSDDLQQQISDTRKKLEIAYTNLTSTQTVLKYRTEAVKQITTNYNQGRTDISFLIDAYNKKVQSEVDAVTAQGFFSTTLLEYQSLIL